MHRSRIAILTDTLNGIRPLLLAGMVSMAAMTSYGEESRPSPLDPKEVG